jgi:hypothetical protein
MSALEKFLSMSVEDMDITLPLGEHQGIIDVTPDMAKSKITIKIDQITTLALDNPTDKPAKPAAKLIDLLNLDPDVMGPGKSSIQAEKSQAKLALLLKLFAANGQAVGLQVLADMSGKGVKFRISQRSYMALNKETGLEEERFQREVRYLGAV